MPHPFAEEARVVRLLCLTAGRAAAQAALRPLHVEYKEDDGRSPVTNADRLANQIVCDGLTDAFVSDALCAEEMASSHAWAGRAGHERVWCVDPIDGTREYIAGSGQWSVMVGLAVGGVASFGAVYETVHDALYMGAMAYGPDGEVAQRWATREQAGAVRPISVSTQSDPSQCRLMVSRHSKSRALDALMGRMKLMARVPLGSVGLKAARLASADAELYACLTDKIHEWDACGPAALLVGAGGQATDLCGAPLQFNKPTTPMTSGLLMSNGRLHDEALRVLCEASANLPYLSQLLRASTKQR